MSAGVCLCELAEVYSSSALEIVRRAELSHSRTQPTSPVRPLRSHQPHKSADLLSAVLVLAGLLDAESLSKASMEREAKLSGQAADFLLPLNSVPAPCAPVYPLWHQHYDSSSRAAAYRGKLTVACIKAQSEAELPQPLLCSPPHYHK